MSIESLEALEKAVAGAVLRVDRTPQGDDTALVNPAQLVEACRWLKSEPGADFKMLSSVTCVDRLELPDADPRFELVYHLYSISRNKRVRLKARVGGGKPEIDSVVAVWRTANWWERHVWDLYGVRFKGHPNLKRLYMYEEFQGHPLRKDYPLKGRQPLIPERDFRDLVRGPGAAPRD